MFFTKRKSRLSKNERAILEVLNEKHNYCVNIQDILKEKNFDIRIAILFVTLQTLKTKSLVSSIMEIEAGSTRDNRTKLLYVITDLGRNKLTND